MTPGAYLNRRREAAGLSLDQVARSMRFTPHVPGPVAARAALLGRIEAGEEPLTLNIAWSLYGAFRFDHHILATLMDRAAGYDLPVPPLCRICACSWHDPCHTEAGPCAWADAEATLCTACLPVNGGEPAIVAQLADPTAERRAA